VYVVLNHIRHRVEIAQNAVPRQTVRCSDPPGAFISDIAKVEGTR
jgi:hypothetical protein